MSIAYNPGIVTNGLVLCLDAGNPRSYSGTGTLWYDLSGEGNNATLYNNPTYSNGSIQVRYASAQYATSNFNWGVLKSDNLTGVWSLEATWKNISPPNSAESFIIGRSGCHGGIYTYPNGSNTDVYHAIKTASCWTGALNVSIATIVPNQIVHSVMTYNAGTVKSYINGELIGTYAFDYTTYGMTGYGDTMFIGGFGNTTYYSSNADIYNVKSYNIALSDQDVLKNFNALRTKYGI